MTQTQPARPGLERPPEPVPPVGAPARPPRGSAFVGPGVGAPAHVGGRTAQTRPAAPGLVRPPGPVPLLGAPARPPRGSAFVRVLRATDHTTIGVRYLVTSMGFFMIGGLVALLM